jgi:Zn-dependent protease
MVACIRQTRVADTTRASRRPSPIFLGLVAVTVVCGFGLWSGAAAPGVFAFLFVTAAWVVSLCLHEFSHAWVAYRYGDHSVVYRGYLTLDPLRYTHVVYSLVLPLLFVVLGGIGLPGGAVFIDRSALKSRFAHTAVSAAGPLSNVAITLALAGALTLQDGPHREFWAAVAFLAFLQLTASILNILPIPGLDGFGIIEPYLPRRLVVGASRFAPFAIVALFGLLWIPPVNQAFFTVIFQLANALGISPLMISIGDSLYRFWL